MTNPKPFWYLRNWQAWVVLGMGVVTALVIQYPWIIALGVIGYLLVLLFDIVGGGSLDRSWFVRLEHAEQENRTMRAERVHLVGGLKEVQARNAKLEAENRQLAQELEALKAEMQKVKG